MKRNRRKWLRRRIIVRHKTNCSASREKNRWIVEMNLPCGFINSSEKFFNKINFPLFLMRDFVRLHWKTLSEAFELNKSSNAIDFNFQSATQINFRLYTIPMEVKLRKHQMWWKWLKQLSTITSRRKCKLQTICIWRRWRVMTRTILSRHWVYVNNHHHHRRQYHSWQKRIKVEVRRMNEWETSCWQLRIRYLEICSIQAATFDNCKRSRTNEKNQ